MRLPGHGNDCLEAEREFAISLYGTDQVFTAEGDALRVRPFRGSREQVWKCIRGRNYRWGFINVATGRYLGKDRYTNLGASAPHFKEWEFLNFTKLSLGGYELTVSMEESSLQPVTCETNDGGPYMKVVPQSFQRIGLHQLSPRPFVNFEWVYQGRLARSSAPHYRSEDSDQNMDEAAVEFLKYHGVSAVVGVNGVCLPQEAILRLNHRGISYDHIPVADFCPPNIQQLQQIRDIYNAQGTVLIYCGYGHGRTGTVISALQMFAGQPLSDADFRANLVETHDQFAVLRQVRAMVGY